MNDRLPWGRQNYEMRRFVARLLGCGRLHRIQVARVAGVEILLRSWRRGSGLAIAVGNRYLRLQRSAVNNVIIHEQAASATWIDFDIRVVLCVGRVEGPKLDGREAGCL